MPSANRKFLLVPRTHTLYVRPHQITLPFASHTTHTTCCAFCLQCSFPSFIYLTKSRFPSKLSSWLFNSDSYLEPTSWVVCVFNFVFMLLQLLLTSMTAYVILHWNYCLKLCLNICSFFLDYELLEARNLVCLVYS